MTEEEEETK